MYAPRHSLHLLFTLSAFCCALVGVLVWQGRAQDTPLFWARSLGVAAVLAAVASALAGRGGRLRLERQPLLDAGYTLLLQLLRWYFVSALLLTTIGLALLMSLTHAFPQALALAALTGLWLALWIAPGLAALSTARRLARAGTAPAAVA